jgi:hypothetical protein
MNTFEVELDVAIDPGQQFAITPRPRSKLRLHGLVVGRDHPEPHRQHGAGCVHPSDDRIVLHQIAPLRAQVLRRVANHRDEILLAHEPEGGGVLPHPHRPFER